MQIEPGYVRLCSEEGRSEMRNMPQTLGQHSNRSEDLSMSHKQHELTLMARAVGQVEIRHSRIGEVATAVQGGRYRVSANILAACLMLEMLH
jgi:anti-sigma28 factor (negative regulator of flagellin synthesis)